MINDILNIDKKFKAINLTNSDIVEGFNNLTILFNDLININN